MITTLLNDIAKPLSYRSNSRTVITALCHRAVCIRPFSHACWVMITKLRINIDATMHFRTCKVMITKLCINIDATVHFHTCKVMITKLRIGLNGWL
jgi:hypothetical protein